MEENQEPGFWEICAQPETRTRSIAPTRSLYHDCAEILANSSDLDNRRIEVALHLMSGCALIVQVDSFLEGLNRGVGASHAKSD